MSNLTPEMQAELDKLRDIRLPDPVGWWPPAPGWWVLLALAVLTFAAIAAFVIRRRHTRRHAALRELAAIRARLADEDANAATDLAVLIRRVALRGPEGRRFAALSGPEWVAELERGEAGLSEAVAASIANAPYAPASAASETLRRAADEAEIWIRRHA